MILIATILIMACGDKYQKNDNIKIEYFENGNVKLKVKLKNGVEHGNYLEFHQNQSVSKSGVKIQGKKNGVWKYYSPSGKLTLAKHFFNDSILYNLDVNDFNFYNKIIDGHFEIKIPKNWNVIGEVNSEQLLLSIKKDCQQKLSFCPSLTITHESPIFDEIEITSYIQKSNDILNTTFDNYRTIKERKFIFEGQIYYEKIYTGKINGVTLGGITTWIFDRKNLYIATGMALNEKGNSFLKQEGLFKDITNSMKLIN